MGAARARKKSKRRSQHSMFKSIIYGAPTEVDHEREFNAVNWRMRSSFLPQDRVNEFAKLKPDELLRETQRVAGHPMLNKWHDLLKDMSAELKTLKGVRFICPSFSMFKSSRMLGRDSQRKKSSARKNRKRTHVWRRTCHYSRGGRR